MHTDGTASTAALAAEDAARRSYGKLLALLAARTRNVTAAEDALADAFAAALADWPTNGTPSNSEGWLLKAAQRRFFNAARHERVKQNAAEHVRLLADELGAASDVDIQDHRLALMFACAHPAIETAIRAPLILHTLLGFDAARIASAFLVPPSAMSQRLVRAKKKIREAGIALAIPARAELPPRLDAVLTAIYAAYAEGWSDPQGGDAARRDLAGEAIFLGSLVCDLLPREAEALGLLALMLHAEARRPARRTSDGEFVPLDAQDASRWDAAMISRAEALLLRASALNSIGRYQLEAALQSAHVDRVRSGKADWRAVVRIYDALFALSGSPVVALNRALAMAEFDGPRAALATLDALASDSRLHAYQPYWAARASLLARADEPKAARQAYETAIGLERDPAVRRYLRKRQQALTD